MEWPVILVLVLVIPVILFPAAFVWYLNVGGLYAAIKEGRVKVLATIGRVVRTAVLVTVPVGIYVFAVWFFFGNLGWPVALALALALPIMLIPVALIWYLNIGGIYAAIKEGGFKVLATVGRVVRTAVLVTTPVGIYAFAVWFFFGNFGWPVALAVALILPIILFVPVLVWAAVVSGLYLVVGDTLRRRVTAPRRRPVTVAEESVIREVA